MQGAGEDDAGAERDGGGDAARRDRRCREAERTGEAADHCADERQRTEDARVWGRARSAPADGQDREIAEGRTERRPEVC
ncbi:MAG: hypothetical protein NVSMB19_24500 [Vulcanimicrobiaceae bacterium]